MTIEYSLYRRKFQDAYSIYIFHGSKKGYIFNPCPPLVTHSHYFTRPRFNPTL